MNILTLGDVATYINGRAFKPDEWEETGLPIIRIQNLTNSSCVCNRTCQKYEDKYLVKEGDLLFAWSASLGAHIWHGEDGWLNQHIFKVVPKDNIEKMYLYYYLLYVVDQLYAKTHGSGMVHITLKPFKATTIPVPSLQTQCSIVNRIESIFFKLDEAKEKAQAVVDGFELRKSAILHKAFTGELTKQWRKSRGSSEKFHGAVVDHDASEKNRVFQEVAWIGKDLEKLSSQILSTCNRAKVAIIMDWENWWALSDAQAISRKFDYTEELLKYYRVFWEKGIEVDIISMDRELLDYQLVVAPTLYLHKKEYIHKVEAYVEAGGIYVTTYWSGVVNETDLCFIGERPHERLLGLSVDEIDVGNEYFPNTFSYKDGVYKAGVLREVVTLQTAKPLGTYLQDYNVNTPAITENAYGKGKAYYVVVQPDLEFLKEFLGDVIEEANVEANLTETLPYGVTVSKRSGKEQKDDVYFLQNFNRHPVKMVLNECYTNLITDEILTGSIKLQTYQCIVMQKK